MDYFSRASVRAALFFGVVVVVGLGSFAVGRALHTGSLFEAKEEGYTITGDAPYFPFPEDAPVKFPADVPLAYVDPGVQARLSVSWLPLEQQDDISQEIPEEVKQYFEEGMDSVDPDQPSFVRELGVVSSGDHEGDTLLLFSISQGGISTYYQNMYMLVPPEKARTAGAPWRLLLRPMLSDTVGWTTEEVALEQLVTTYPSKPGVEADVTTEIPELHVPTLRVQTADGLAFIVDSVSSYRVDKAFLPLDYPVRATLEDGTVLREFDHFAEQGVRGDLNGLFSVRKDGRAIWYDVAIPFWDGLSAPNPFRESGVPNVFLQGKQNTATYAKGEPGGCGFLSKTHVVSLKEIGELVSIGYFVEGERQEIFAPVDLARPYFEPAFTTWKSSDETRTFEQFKALVPFFYYKDELGRWIEFGHADVIPAFECGKPVIYLYPETTTDLHVEVAPRGGFSYTEPVYRDGWNVTAEPDGTLTNKEDGKIYPYLFWEGRGGSYAPPERYWVVAQADVHTFLVATLAKLGLNEKESSDFIEFWEPRMQGSLYYRVGFHGTNIMNQIAPLTLSEKPDAILRILMDFDPLDAWAPSNPPAHISSFERKGFTVVEWGGVIE